jgi:hypothetical protein
MPGTRFSTKAANYLLSSGVTIKNGTGGGAPALQENAAYPMSNLLKVDRHTVWATGISAPNPTLVHIDLGQDRALTFFAVLGMRQPPGAAGNTITSIFGTRTAALGYSGVSTDYIDRATVTVPTTELDGGVVAASATGRYLQVKVSIINTSLGLTLGKFAAGLLDQDLGANLVYSPGAEGRLVTPQVRTETMAGFPVISYVGSRYVRFLLPFNAITTATKNQLDAVAKETDPFVYFNQFDVARECVAPPEYAVSHRWAPPDLWDSVLELRSLG